MPRKRGGKEGDEGGSGAQKRGPALSRPDAVGPNKKTSTLSTSDRSTKTKTTNQTTISALCLIIKGFYNQAQKLNYQI
jgi:hypothetical protein